MSTHAMYTAFTPANLQFLASEKNRKGGKIIPISSNGNRTIRIQTPAVTLPFGVTPYMDPKTNETESYSMDISFRGHDTDPRLADFLARMIQLDEVLLTAAVTNSKDWFGKSHNKDLVAEFLRKLVKHDPTGRYAPTMKVKVPSIRGEPTCNFYDEAARPVSIDAFEKGCTVKLIIELSTVWFVNKNFGVTWRLQQAQVVDRPKRMQKFAFTPEEVQTLPSPPPVPTEDTEPPSEPPAETGLA